jgi:Mn2+/Fe2+ NRAMP family transporter
LVAVSIGFAGVPPIKLLFFSGIAGGIATPLTLALMLLVGRNPKIMRKARIPGWLAVAGWSVTAVVATATVIYLGQTLTGHGS